MYITDLFWEGLIIGVILQIFTFFIDFFTKSLPFGKYYDMIIVGFVVHIFLDIIGFNKKYCTDGAACKYNVVEKVESSKQTTKPPKKK